MIAAHESTEGYTEVELVELASWEELEADSLERWPEQRLRIREIRADLEKRITHRPITTLDMINECIREEVFTAVDNELFMRLGVQRRVLNACQDMRTGRRG